METSAILDDVPDDPFAVMTREPRVLTAVPTERLEAELCTLAAHIDAALCRFLMMVGEYDRRRGWEEWEARSCAHWLAWKCGISLGTAREHVRVAHALETLPLLRDAFASGLLSYSKVRAITRIAEPAIEGSLIEIAQGSTATGLERICRSYRRYGGTRDPNADADADADNRAYQARSFTWYYDDDGSMVFRGRVPAEHAPTILAMLKHGRDARDQPDPGTTENVPAGTPTNANNDDPDTPGERDIPAGTPRADEDSLAARNADAFVLAAEAFLVRGAAPVGAGVELTVILDEAVLHGGGGTCHVDGGSSLSSHVARRLACDCGAVAAVLGQNGDPLYVSEHHRLPNRRLRRALALRDKHCQFPGCDHKGRLQPHHIHHWIDGGRTTLTNLVMTCAKHHRAVHEGGYTLHRIDGEIVVHRPDGKHLTYDLPHINTTAMTIETQHRDQRIDIDHATNQCLWEGRAPNTSDIICHLDTKITNHRRQHDQN